MRTAVMAWPSTGMLSPRACDELGDFYKASFYESSTRRPWNGFPSDSLRLKKSGAAARRAGLWHFDARRAVDS